MAGAAKPGRNRSSIAELDRKLAKLVMVAEMHPLDQSAMTDQIACKLQECHAMRIATFQSKRAEKSSWLDNAIGRARG
jgi:hypothetical protein